MVRTSPRLFVRLTQHRCHRGCTGDGTAFSQSSMVSQNGELPIYVSLYKVKGSLAGTFLFEATDTGDLDGTLDWTKPANDKESFYPGGFAIPVPTVGAVYTKPATNTHPSSI